MDLKLTNITFFIKQTVDYWKVGGGTAPLGPALFPRDLDMGRGLIYKYMDIATTRPSRPRGAKLVKIATHFWIKTFSIIEIKFP